MLVERAHRPDRDPALAEIQRQRRRDRVAEAVGDGNPEDDARAAAAVEIIREQVGRQGRQDVLNRAVFVHVAGDPQRGELFDLLRAGDRAAEHQDRQPPFVELANRTDQVHTPGVRQPEIQYDEVDAIAIGPYAGEQLGGALDGQGGMTRPQKGGGEPVAHERGVVRHDDGLDGGHRCSRHV